MLIPVILSGGSGTRLWPVSREAQPKPFIRLPDGQSLIQKTLQRVAALPGVEQALTVTNREHYFLTRDEYARSGFALSHAFLLEPSGRNTAPAVALAALWAAERHGEQAVLLVLPADHLISPLESFAHAVEKAARAARDGYLVTFGIRPTHAETGFGYIEVGEALPSGEASEVRRFVEKPRKEVAEHFLASGRHLWNSGMFCFGAGAFLEALRGCHPQLHDEALACYRASRAQEGAADAGERVSLDSGTFQALPDISIDYAVMEKHPKVAVVPCDFQWSDVGSWTALADLTTADAEGNRVSGEAVMVDSRDCYVQSGARMVAAVGVHDLVVVDTPDALLVAHRNRVQDVKEVAKKLKLTNHAAYLHHRTVNRPWGSYTVLDEGPGFKIKRIVVKPGASLSLQMHYHRSEHWVVVSGTASVVNDDREFLVRTNESTYIPAGHRHRLANPGKVDLMIIEVQSGNYLEEDDIVRFEDVYGRS